MKKLLNITSILTLVLFVNVNAQAKSTISVKAPYVSISCDHNGESNMGGLGLRLNRVDLNENNESISLTINQSLEVCTNKDNEQSWMKVNPFKGFTRQYFDIQTSRISNSVNQINSKNLANRFEVILTNQKDQIVASELFNNESFENNQLTLTINKNLLLNNDDLTILKNGKSVVKQLSLFSILNMTTYIKTEALETGDIAFSGRNIFIEFKNENDSLLVNKLIIK